MVRRNLFALVLITLMGPLCALAATSDHFRVRSTADLVEICSTPATDSLYAAAISFCHGYASRSLPLLPGYGVWTRG